MHVPADSMENKENMILKMIRKSNEAILNFIMGIKLRRVGATLLGALAGLSLVSNIIPQAMEFTGNMESFSTRWALGGFAVYSMIVWGIGGRAAQKAGDKKLGAVILGSVGLASGMIFSGVGIACDMNTLVTGGCAGMLYGTIGGLIIGDALRDPVSNDINGTGKSGSDAIGDLQLFKYFKK